MVDVVSGYLAVLQEKVANWANIIGQVWDVRPVLQSNDVHAEKIE